MTREKWMEIFSEESHEMMKAWTDCYNSPENWPTYREVVLSWIKGLDEAHEVYTMENQEKKS